LLHQGRQQFHLFFDLDYFFIRQGGSSDELLTLLLCLADGALHGFARHLQLFVLAV
jgi:hypothetical protein